MRLTLLSVHNMRASRETFEKAGGFPQHLMTCEDFVFADRANKLGTLFRSSKDTYVHMGEDSHLGDVFRNERWRSHLNFATPHSRVVKMISFIAPMIVVFELDLSPVVALSGHAAFAVWLFLLGLAQVLACNFHIRFATAGRLSFLSIFGCYMTYFEARGIGMTQGISNAIRIRGASGNGIS